MNRNRVFQFGLCFVVLVFVIFSSSAALCANKKEGATNKAKTSAKSSAELQSGTLPQLVMPYSFQVPANPNRLVADRKGKPYLLYKGGLFYGCNDPGDEWCKLSDNTISLAVDHNNKELLYSVNTSVHYSNTKHLVRKSTDGGKNWIEISNGLPSDPILRTIVINPHNTQEIYVLTGAGLFKTADAGFAWSRTGLYGAVHQLLIHPKDKSTCYALTDGGLHISKDSGATWSRIDDTLPKRLVQGKGRTAETLPIIVQAIALTSLNSPALLAMTPEKGILKTGDNGKTWTDFNNGFNKADGVYSYQTTNSDIFMGSDGSVYHPSSDGAKWEKVTFLTGQSGTAAGIIGIYPPEAGTKGMIIYDNRAKIHYVDKDNNLIALNDGVMPHSKITNLKSIVVDGKPRVFAFLKNQNHVDANKFGLFESTNSSKTWQQNSVTLMCQAGAQSFNSGYGFSIISVSPYNNKEIWLFALDDSWAPQAFSEAVTYDGGQTWTSPNKFLRWRPTSIGFHPNNPDIRYVCAGNVYRYDIKTKNTIDLKVKARNLLHAKGDPQKMLADSHLSVDGGWTWKDLRPSMEGLGKEHAVSIEQRRIDPIFFEGNSIILYIHETKRPDYLLSSNDLGNSWEILLKQGHKSTDSYYKDGSAVYIDPVDLRTMFVTYTDVVKKEQGKEENVFFIIKSSDHGHTWKPFAQYTPSNREFAISSALIAITKEGGKEAVFVGTLDGLYRTLDDGQTWELLGGIKTSDGGVKNNLRITPPSPIVDTLEPAKVEPVGKEPPSRTQPKEKKKKKGSY
ncbi:MAG: hypothetical protein NT178_18805 [Proteobacteria bacterium]|nr:hypothetical protein [Pseudomonadota bacterium]